MLVKLALILDIESIVWYHIHNIKQSNRWVYKRKKHVYIYIFIHHRFASSATNFFWANYHLLIIIIQNILIEYFIYNMIIFHAPPTSWKQMNLDHFPPYSTPFGVWHVPSMSKNTRSAEVSTASALAPPRPVQTQGQTVSQQQPEFISWSK